MDDVTKEMAKKKAKTMVEHIGFPSGIVQKSLEAHRHEIFGFLIFAKICFLFFPDHWVTANLNLATVRRDIRV